MKSAECAEHGLALLVRRHRPESGIERQIVGDFGLAEVVGYGLPGFGVITGKTIDQRQVVTCSGAGLGIGCCGLKQISGFFEIAGEHLSLNLWAKTKGT